MRKWDRKKTTSENIEQRFWDKVKKGSGCWEWQGCRMKRLGHGQFQTLEKVDYAHRFSWELHNGKIPNGMSVLHKCDNGSCVNPDHLFLGTQEDNVADMMNKGRRKYKLSKTVVDEIRGKYKGRKYGCSRLGAEYGVSPVHILRIVRNEVW